MQPEKKLLRIKDFMKDLFRNLHIMKNFKKNIVSKFI